MSEIALPDQDQLGELYCFAAETMAKNAFVVGSGAESQPKSSIHGQPYWSMEDDFNFEFSVASSVLQRLAPDQAKVLGISVDTADYTLTEFAYEPLRQWADPEPGENLAYYIEGGRLVIASTQYEEDFYTTMHSINYIPPHNYYDTDIRCIEDDLMPSGFERDFTMRVYTAVRHMFAILPQIAQLKF